ncbi:MAG: phosphotransferase family protein, partial [Pseudomonadales bacterium]
MTEKLKGIEVGNVCAWLEANIKHTEPPFTFELIAAGGSNLTYKVIDGKEGVFALRRPPVRAQIATAHDMSREYRIMSALAQADVDVPVPQMLGYCDDSEVTGAEFYCMEWVDGLILRDQQSAAGMSIEQCRTATESLVDVQIAFHTLDLEAVGLADLAKHTAYVERQLKRWKKQVEAAKTRDLPLLDALYDTLNARIPSATAAPGLAHGDYRFDNTVIGADFRIKTVLDWELCTIGDPVADFFWSLMYWADPDDDITFLPDPPTCAGNFMRREDVLALYGERSGFDLSNRDFYTAFSWWKSACIVEG